VEEKLTELRLHKSRDTFEIMIKFFDNVIRSSYDSLLSFHCARAETSLRQVARREAQRLQLAVRNATATWHAVQLCRATIAGSIASSSLLRRSMPTSDVCNSAVKRSTGEVGIILVVLGSWSIPAPHSGGPPFRGSGSGLGLGLTLADLRNGDRNRLGLGLGLAPLVGIHSAYRSI